MPNHDIRSIYLERARQAEHWAALFAEGDLRNSWLTIAAEYRALAKGTSFNRISIYQTAVQDKAPSA
jgi:hypothetical protein